MPLILKLVPSLAVATRWSLRPPWTEPAARVGQFCFLVPAALMRPFHIVFKLMFSILTLLWIFGFHGPHTGVLSRKPQAPLKGIFSSASASTDESAPCLFFFLSVLFGKETCQDVSSCRKSVSSWHAVAQK